MYAPEWANTSPFDLVRHKTNLTGSRLAIERQLMTIKNISACFVNVFGVYLLGTVSVVRLFDSVIFFFWSSSSSY